MTKSVISVVRNLHQGNVFWKHYLLIPPQGLGSDWHSVHFGLCQYHINSLILGFCELPESFLKQYLSSLPSFFVSQPKFSLTFFDMLGIRHCWREAVEWPLKPWFVCLVHWRPHRLLELASRSLFPPWSHWQGLSAQSCLPSSTRWPGFLPRIFRFLPNVFSILLWD